MVCVFVELERNTHDLANNKGRGHGEQATTSSAVGSINSHASQETNNELVTASLTKVDTVRLPQPRDMSALESGVCASSCRAVTRQTKGTLVR